MSYLDAASAEDPPRAARPAAFRRPLLILAYVAYLLLAGFAVAAPWSSLIHATVTGYPRGDAELFDRGGIMLVEALRLAVRGAPAAMTSSGFAVLLAGAVGLVPFAVLIAGLGREGRVRAPFLAARAARAIGTLTLLWGISFAAQAIFGAILSLIGAKIIGGLHLAERGEALAYVVLAAVVLLALLPLGVARDLAAVSAVNDETRFYTSSTRALRVLRRAFGRALGGYLVRALLSLAVLLAAFSIPGALRGSDAPPGVALPFAIHQLAMVIAVFLRASWLASAIRLLDDRAPLARPDPMRPPEPEPVLAPEPLAESEPLAEPEPLLEPEPLFAPPPRLQTELEPEPRPDPPLDPGPEEPPPAAPSPKA
jgi:hypothetical protein